MKRIRVVELFAGVGGFHLGLARANNKSTPYEVIWSNQWEPGSKTQYASEIYKKRFTSTVHSCEDIAVVIEKNLKSIPEHDLLVGGFPCQDYSVAHTLSSSKGLEGEKGVLWWSILRILEKRLPKYLMLENVDRLLKSPASQRGRDFSIMLTSLSDLGYAVEWRVINASEYGFPQRRKRVYILGYKRGSCLHTEMGKNQGSNNWINNNGVFAKAFPVKNGIEKPNSFELVGTLAEISKIFSSNKPQKSPFENAGFMFNRNVFTSKVTPRYGGPFSILKDYVIDEKDVPIEFFIDEKDLPKWKYLKGGKKEVRKTKTGHQYYYSEGPVAFPDSLDKPARTIVTGEGGTAPSRFKHIIRTASGKYRRLTPLELERINMFPDGHTKEAPDVKRAFIMGNALVVGVIEKLGKSLSDYI